MAAAQMLPGRKQAPEKLGRVCMLGLGVSGRAVAEYLLAQPAGRVDELTVFTGQAAADDACAQRLAEAGARVVAADEVEGRFDLCIASPGIPESSAFYRSGQAASALIVSEVELAWRESPADALWVGITGTNGKTTTTALLEHVLNASGFAAKACGNIGDACIHAVGQDILGADRPPERPRVYVAEVSSYQLASIRSFAPEAGIFLGITPDHLAWHGSFQAYANAKWKLLQNMERAGGVAVLDATNDAVRAQVRTLRKLPASEGGFSYVPVGAKAGIGVDMREACGAANAAFLDAAEHLHVAYQGAECVLAPAEALQIKGAHNVVNALAAASAAIALGADAVRVTEALGTFRPLEHRIEPVGTVSGVRFYNDSKATNVDATLVALTAFPKSPLIVMLGGRDKMGPLGELVAACEAHASAVVAFGEAAERFCHAFADAGGSVHVERTRTFDEAFREAVSLAQPGAVVLLSPACASFDEFGSFEERGSHFKDLVAALAADQA